MNLFSTITLFLFSLLFLKSNAFNEKGGAVGDITGVIDQGYKIGQRVSGNSPGELALYRNANYNVGFPFTKVILPISNRCSNLPDQYNDIASAIDTYGNCVMLFEHGDCRGQSVRVAPGTGCHSRLSDCDFDDKLTSYMPC